MKSIVVLTNDQLIKKVREIKRGRFFRLFYYHMGNDRVESRLAQFRVPGERKNPTRKVPTDTFYYYDVMKDGIRGPKKHNIVSFKYAGTLYTTER